MTEWEWKNCRSLGIGFKLWVWPMVFNYDVTEDCYGGVRTVGIGPIELSLSYNIGYIDGKWRERIGALDPKDVDKTNAL